MGGGVVLSGCAKDLLSPRDAKRSPTPFRSDVSAGKIRSCVGFALKIGSRNSLMTFVISCSNTCAITFPKLPRVTPRAIEALNARSISARLWSFLVRPRRRNLDEATKLLTSSRNAVFILDLTCSAFLWRGIADSRRRFHAAPLLVRMLFHFGRYFFALTRRRRERWQWRRYGRRLVTVRTLDRLAR
jgi:hypothetical protein